MQNFSLINCVEEVGPLAAVRCSTIRCYMYPPLTSSTLQPRLRPDREVTRQALALLMRIDAGLRDARADWNEDRFRRLMRLRPKAVRRLRRRWVRLDPKPVLPLGNLRRRYHSNIAAYLNPI